MIKSVSALFAVCKHAQTESIQLDEAGCILLIVNIFRFERCDLVIVKAVFRPSSGDMASALVKFHADIAGDILLAFGDSDLKHFAFGSIPETIVDHLGVDGNEAVAEVHDFFIHGDGFQSTVCMVKNGSARSFINTAGFHTDETVFDDIDSSDSVSCTEFVQAAHDICGGEFFPVDCPQYVDDRHVS